VSYTDRTIKELFGRSFNECNHPDCDKIIVVVDSKTNRAVVCGDIAHIRGRKSTAERYDRYYPKENINTEENLLLLCPNHHRPIDEPGAGEYYTIELLEKWKLNHYLSKENEKDRGWVYGYNSLVFFFDGQQIELNYWLDKKGNTRIFTQEQLKQVKAAKDVAMLLSQFQGLIDRINSVDGKPANPHHISMNDACMQQLKKDIEHLGKSWTVGDSFDTPFERLYGNLAQCRDITLKELSLVGSVEKQSSTSILVGDATPERVLEALKSKTE